MSRLLFAAARGARIEEPYGDSGRWIAAKTVPNPRYPDVLYHTMRRIHPDDEHLQYGKFSAACRNEAEAPRRYYFIDHSDELLYALSEFTQDRELSVYDRCNDALHRSLFLLILAEALADEGL